MREFTQPRVLCNVAQLCTRTVEKNAFAIGPNPSLEFENIEDASGKVTNEEHGRDAHEDGEEAPFGAVGHLEAETITKGENPIITQ